MIFYEFDNQIQFLMCAFFETYYVIKLLLNKLGLLL